MKETNIKSNTVYNVIKSVSAVVFPLISFPYASRVLLAEGIGKVNFGNSVVSYFSLIASLGVYTYAVRECATVKKDRNELGQVASQLFSLNLITTLVAYALLGLTLIFARPLHDYRALIVLQSTVVIFTTIGAEWLNVAMEDFKFITLRTVFFQALSLVLMFSFVHSPDDYMKYALISLVSSSGAHLTNLVYRRRYCRVHFACKMDLRRHLPPVMLMFSLTLSQIVYVNSDITILGLFCGDHEVGLYSTAVKIYNIVNPTVASVAYVVMSKLSYAFTQKDYRQVNEHLRYGLNFIVVLGLPCVVGLNMVAPEVIQIMAGEEFLGAVPMLRILTIALTGSFFGGFVANLIMIPSGREKICLQTSLISAVVNLVLNLIFIPLYGGVAAAATTATAEVLGFLVISRRVEKEIEVWDFKKIFFAPLVGCLTIIIAIIVVKAIVVNLFICTILCVGVSVVVYLAVLVIMKHEFTLNMLKKRNSMASK